MRNKENPMLISFSDLPEEKRWEACLSELRYEYTLSFKKMCRILKCSRNWAVRYLKPHLHYIYLANGSGRNTNYLRIANIILGRNMTESTWYSKNEFEKFILNHIKSIRRQTINIPIELLIKEDKLEYFKENFIPFKKIKENLESTNAIDLFEKRVKEREQLIKECLSQRGNILWKNVPSKYKRTDSPSVECKLDVIDIYEFMAVHDLKNYGDTEEEIYRDLFSKGCYRLVLKIPDIHGHISEKIYYLQPQNEFSEMKSAEMILVNYADYVRLYHNI